ADPGAHTAELRRGGTVLAREYFAVQARSTRRIELRVGSIATEPPDPGKGPETSPTGPAPDRGARTAPGETPPPSVVPPAGGRLRRAPAWAHTGRGAPARGAMGVFIGERPSARASLTSACPSLTHCPTSAASTVSAGKTDAMLVNVAAVAGSVLAATGVVLLV